MATPHISIRVDKDRLGKWKDLCSKSDTDLSTQVRKLMDAWVRVEELQAVEEAAYYDDQIRLLQDAKLMLENS